MKIVAEKRVTEFSEVNIEISKTMFIVKDGETVEELLNRIGIDGSRSWEYDMVEVRIKLVKEQ